MGMLVISRLCSDILDLYKHWLFCRENAEIFVTMPVKCETIKVVEICRKTS